MRMPRDETPLVSILMGTLYRSENVELLARAVRSIQDQTYSNWEFLICDDGSSPAALSYLDEAAAKDSRIRLIRGCPRYDLASKLNWCLSAARGEYIARMDDDDYSHPDRLLTQMDYLQNCSQAAFVGCIARLEREGQPAGLRRLPERPVIRDFYMTQPFFHPTLLFRRKILEEAGGYSETPRCMGCEDYDLLLRIYEAGHRGENIQKPLFTYTLPPLDSRKRTMALRWNEVKTRYVRFRALGLLPGALPYVVKPVAVGLIPERGLERMKQFRNREKVVNGE